MPRICTVAMNAATNPPGALPMSVTHSKTGWASLSRATGQKLFRGAAAAAYRRQTGRLRLDLQGKQSLAFIDAVYAVR
jgi:hypothetical protein